MMRFSYKVQKPCFWAILGHAKFQKKLMTRMGKWTLFYRTLPAEAWDPIIIIIIIIITIAKDKLKVMSTI